MLNDPASHSGVVSQRFLLIEEGDSGSTSVLVLRFCFSGLLHPSLNSLPESPALLRFVQLTDLEYIVHGSSPVPHALSFHLELGRWIGDDADGPAGRVDGDDVAVQWFGSQIDGDVISEVDAGMVSKAVSQSWYTAGCRAAARTPVRTGSCSCMWSDGSSINGRADAYWADQ